MNNSYICLKKPSIYFKLKNCNYSIYIITKNLLDK